MKKIILAALTAAMAVSAMAIGAVADEPIKILVNGAELNIPADDTQPFIEEERTLVPMRAIFEALGASVSWDGDTKTIVSYDPVSDVSITMQIDSAKMFVGETPVELDVPAKIVGDRTVVPIRAIAEGMNSVVGWDGATRTVTVDKEMQPSTPTPTTEPSAEVENPWIDYKTLDELNAAIVAGGPEHYVVYDPSTPCEVKENGYRYMPTANLSEILARWEVGEGFDVTIRTGAGTADISGIYGGALQEEYTLETGEKVSISKLDNTTYAQWSCDQNGTTLTHCVYVEAEGYDTTDVVKALVKDVKANDNK